jgi:hypothetical protein
VVFFRAKIRRHDVGRKESAYPRMRRVLRRISLAHRAGFRFTGTNFTPLIPCAVFFPSPRSFFSRSRS